MISICSPRNPMCLSETLKGLSGPLGREPGSDRGRSAAAIRKARRTPGLAALILPLLALAVPSGLAGQEAGARDAAARQKAAEVASMLDLATTEYSDAVRDGRVVNEMEYAESREFTSQAAALFEGLRAAAGRGSDVAASVAARLDSLGSVVEAKGPVERYRGLATRVGDALAQEWGAVSVAAPDRRPSAAHGARLYRQACAACHGPTGDGDGWAAAGMSPAPPDFTAAARHAEATAARDYQVILYGIPETAMPSHRDWLSVEETWDLVAYLQTLRHTAADVAEGEDLALEGLPGEDDEDAGPIAGRLRAWSSPEEVARLTDADLAQRVRAAWNAASGGSASAPDGGSASPAEAAASASERGLSGEQVRSVVAYLRALMGTPDRGVPEADRTARVSAAVERADSLAGAAAAAAREGRTEQARTTAVQAYMAFEGIEPELRSRDAGLVRDVEAAFGDFRGAVTRVRSASAAEAAGAERRPDAAATTAAGTSSTVVDEELEAVRRSLSRAEDVLTSPVTALSLGTQSFFIILREGFEAILIIGAILAFLMKTGHEERKRDIYWGVGAALAASVATAFVLQEVVAATPASRELLEGATMLLAVAVLFSVSYWLLSKLEHEKWEKYLRSKMRSALGAGSGLALAGVAFLAVYREGFETVIFYQALAGFAEGGATPLAAGFVVGCAVLAGIYVAFTRFGMKIPMRPFFAVTSGVLYYMAVVFAGSGVRELQQAGVIGATRLDWAPTLDLLGIYPTVETLAAQGLLLLLLLGALAVTFGPSLAPRSSGSGRPRAA